MALRRPGLTLADLNASPRDTFAAALDGIWEHSPWIAARAWDQRPFADAHALHEAMVRVVAASKYAEQRALLLAHPELAGKAAEQGSLTPESQQEQLGAGLDRCTPEELTQITALNGAYGKKFGVPFIIAVRGHTRSTIIAELSRRLARAPDEEHAEALAQVAAIARNRLSDRLRTATPI